MKNEFKEFLARVTEEQKDWLRRESFETRVSQSEILRVAIDQFRKLSPVARDGMYDKKKD